MLLTGFGCALDDFEPDGSLACGEGCISAHCRRSVLGVGEVIG